MCFNHAHDHGAKPALDIKQPEAATALGRRKVIQGAVAGGAIIASPALASCATNAETGRKQFVGLAPGSQQLSTMAAASWAEMKEKIPTSSDPRYTNRLRNIGGRIARGAKRSNQKWDYTVFDQDTKNAFVLPGNRVGFYKGMMDFTDNDDQIAGIMGHEVGHVSGQHARERYSMQMASQVAVAGGTIIGASQMNKKCNKYQGAARDNCLRSANRNTQYLAQALGLGAMVGLVLPYSRKHEAESDLLGANYMQRAGYDPYQSVKLWEKMAADSPSRQPTFLSTHPDPAWRARNLDEYIRRQEKMGSQGFKNIRT